MNENYSFYDSNKENTVRDLKATLFDVVLSEQSQIDAFRNFSLNEDDPSRKAKLDELCSEYEEGLKDIIRVGNDFSAVIQRVDSISRSINLFIDGEVDYSENMEFDNITEDIDDNEVSSEIVGSEEKITNDYPVTDFTDFLNNESLNSGSVDDTIKLDNVVPLDSEVASEVETEVATEAVPVTEVSSEVETEVATEVVSEVVTEVATEAVPVTEAPTEVVSEVVTEVATEAVPVTEVSTEVASEVETEAVTEAVPVTEAPTEGASEVVTEVATEEIVPVVKIPMPEEVAEDSKAEVSVNTETPVVQDGVVPLISIPLEEETTNAPVVEAATLSTDPIVPSEDTITIVKRSTDAPKAILTTKKQVTNLRNSLASQEAIYNMKNNQENSSTEINANMLVENGLLEGTVEDKQAKIESLLEQANNLYKEGKVEESQAIYDQISLLNKELQQEPSTSFSM